MRLVGKRALPALLALLLALGLAPWVLAAEGEAVTMRLTKTQGTVEASKSSGKAVSVISDMRLYNGYRLKTAEESYAWISLDGTKLAKLDASSDVSVRKNGKKLELLLNSGNVFFNVAKPLEDDESLSIRTATMVVGIRGTSGWVEIQNERTSRVSVLEGTVRVSVADPASGESKSGELSGGERASCVVYRPEKAGDRCDILREGYGREEVRGFVLRELAEDGGLRDEIFEKSGLDLRELTPEEADARQKEDEEDLRRARDAVRDALDNQKGSVSKDPALGKITRQPSGGAGNSGDSGGSDDSGGSGSAGNTGGSGAPPASCTVTFELNGGYFMTPEGEMKTTAETAVPSGGRLALADGNAMAVISTFFSQGISAPAGSSGSIEGWYTNAAGTGTAFDLTAPITGSVKLYAKWIPGQCTVTLSLSQTVRYYGSDVEFGVGDGNTLDSLNPASITVNYGDSLGDRLPTGNVVLLEPVGSASNREVEDYAFAGWFDNPEGTGTAYTPDTPVMEDVALYSRWTQVRWHLKLEKGAVPEQNEGAAGPYVPGKGADSPVWPGRVPSVPDGTAPGTGLPMEEIQLFRTEAGGLYTPSTVYKFGGWNTAADGTGETYTRDTVISGNATLYAQWVPLMRYTVRLVGNAPADNGVWLGYLNGPDGDFPASWSDRSETVIENTCLGDRFPFIVLCTGSHAVPDPAPYDCAGWFDNPEGTGTAYTSDTPITRDVTLYAKWVHQ